MNDPDYPFRYVGILSPESRAGALRDIEYHADRVSYACGHFMPRVSKEEFLKWVADLWDDAEREFHEHMSLPDA